jgi:DNA-binding response OmpR family regulator
MSGNKFSAMAEIAAREITILIADDSPLVRQALAKLLQAAGFGVITASNGETAVSLYQKLGKAINLVLLDLEMPLMDGGEAYRRLRAINPQVKAIIVSGCTPNEAQRYLGDEKGVPYLQKPVIVSTLLAQIEAMLMAPNGSANGSAKKAAPREAISPEAAPAATPVPINTERRDGDAHLL